MTTTPTQEIQPNSDTTPTIPPRQKGPMQKILAFTVKSIITLAIITAGILAAYQLYVTKPKAAKKPKPTLPTLVTTQNMSPQSFTVTVEAFGTVEPARTIDIQPRVTGVITSIHPNLVPGQFLPADQVIANIEADDYKIAKVQREADLIKATSDLQIEKGRQSVAEREYNMLANTSELAEDDKALILRKPQNQIAEANILSAQNALDRAELDLARTTIHVPFNATVMQKHTDLGALVSPSTRIVSLIGTDQYWLRLLVPTNDLKWIFSSENKNHSATIFNDYAWKHLAKNSRNATVAQLAPELEIKGRLAQIILTVDDPLALKPQNADQPKLLISMYVRSIITGPTLDNVYVIPRKAVHDNNTVWIMNSENKLDIRTIDPIWENDQYMITRSALQPNDQLVISNIATPSAGITLKIAK
ncbi:efflux RND transporter periplasmic adaptor subunit [Poriferisphaera sp. WC338]|uniref:efflux RND transporter periplasmic adaptor subunit n=1 Tax=Poriferisphaera sp. WC338 TaxID=3425129 RepID=UPI003D8131AC